MTKVMSNDSIIEEAFRPTLYFFALLVLANNIIPTIIAETFQSNHMVYAIT
ncbi:unnamed protein product, partial [marine sediment metagenome]